MELFSSIKAAVPIVDAAQRYGLQVDRHNRALCPFHDEKTPSFKLYPDTSSFYCFGCQAHGDVLDLVAHMTGAASPLEAAKILNSDFALGLDLKGSKPDLRVARKRQQDKARLDAFDRWCEWACGVLIDYHKALRRWKVEHAPQSPGVQLHPLFVEALQMEEYIEYLFLSVFIRGDFSTKADFFKTHEAEVQRYDQRRKAGAA